MRVKHRFPCRSGVRNNAALRLRTDLLGRLARYGQMGISRVMLFFTLLTDFWELRQIGYEPRVIKKSLLSFQTRDVSFEIGQVVLDFITQQPVARRSSHVLCDAVDATMAMASGPDHRFLLAQLLRVAGST